MTKKQLNQHVMTAAFRQGLTETYEKALAKHGVVVSDVKPHIIGSATVTVTEAELAILREKYGNTMLELTPHGNSGAIELFLPEGEKYITKNRPTMTDEEREAKNSKKGTLNREEAMRRRTAKATLRARLRDLHKIDLDGGETE